MAASPMSYTQVIVSVDGHHADVYYLSSEHDKLVEQVLTPFNYKELDILSSAVHDEGELQVIRLLGGDYTDDSGESTIGELSVKPTMPCLINRVINISMPMMM
jgi:hypothetical protein